MECHFQQEASPPKWDEKYHINKSTETSHLSELAYPIQKGPYP